MSLLIFASVNKSTINYPNYCAFPTSGTNPSAILSNCYDNLLSKLVLVNSILLSSKF